MARSAEEDGECPETEPPRRREAAEDSALQREDAGASALLGRRAAMTAEQEYTSRHPLRLAENGHCCQHAHQNEERKHDGGKYQ